MKYFEAEITVTETMTVGINVPNGCTVEEAKTLVAQNIGIIRDECVTYSPASFHVWGEKETDNERTAAGVARVVEEVERGNTRITISQTD